MRIPLDLPPGLNGDDTSFADAGHWADGSNVRFRLGRAQVIGGWESLVATPLTGVCRTVFPWTDNTAVLNVAFGSHSKLQLWQGGALFDITPASGFTAGAIDGAGSAGYGTGAWGVGGYGQPSTTDYFPLTWSFGAWGQNLLASPRNQTIFAWTNSTASKAVALPNAPANVTFMLVAPLNGGYLKSVVGATSADLDANDSKVRAQQALDLAGSGAFGGSGAALTQSATEGELERARATTLGNLRSQGYAQALSGATSQAQLQQQQQAQRLAAAGQLAGIAGQYGADQRANVATQTATGDDLRNITQQQDQAPVTSTAQIVAMLNGLPINLFTGQTSEGTSNTATKGQSTNVNAGVTANFTKIPGVTAPGA